MAGKNRYNLAKEFIEKIAEEYTHLSDAQLRNLISIHLGSDEKRCVNPYLKLMGDTGMTKPEENGWEINNGK